MPRTISGDFGQAVFASASDDSGAVVGRYLRINTQASLNFFRSISIVKPNIILNEMGLFTFQQAGRDGEVHFANMTVPRHMLSKRKNGCVWYSKGKMHLSTKSYPLCPIEYNGEQCPDAFYGTCLEKILGVGNQVRDILATPEGRALFAEMVNNLYLGLGNDFYDLTYYGQHPLIDAADENDSYTVNDQEWEDYKDQQEACGGIMTAVDHYKDMGHPQYNVPIYRSEVSEDGRTFIGSAMKLFRRVLDNQNTPMKMLSKRNNASRNGRMMKAIILASPEIFRAYEDELSDGFSHIDAMFEYKLNGQFCQQVGCDGNETMKGVLRYDGHLVVCMDEWEDFDNMLGIKTHRVMAVTPGVFAIGYDVPSIDQFGGMGMTITQKLDAPWKGKTFMDTTFKMRPTIINEDYIVNASLVLAPF